jgi:hypothetical protein
MSDRTVMSSGRNGSIVGRRFPHLHDQPVEVIGQRRGEKRDAEPRDVLRQAQGHGQHRVQKPHQRPRSGGDQETRPEVRAEEDRQPAHHRAHGHDPLDPEVQHPRPLAQKRAEHPEDQRRRDPQDGGPEAGGEKEIKRLGHRRTR